MIRNTEGKDITTGEIPVRHDGTYETENATDSVDRIVNGICDGAYRLDAESIDLRTLLPPGVESMTMRDFVGQLDRAIDPDKVSEYSRFTPEMLTKLHEQIVRHKIAVAAVLLTRQSARDIFEVKGWERWYSPALLHEDVERGHLGSLADMRVYADFSPDAVLDGGEVYLLAHPKDLWRGDWNVNPKGVAKGVRLG